MKKTGIIKLISIILAVFTGAVILCSCGNDQKDVQSATTASAKAEAASSSSENSGETKLIDPSEYKKYGIVSLAPFSSLKVNDEIQSDDEVTSKLMQMLTSYPGMENDSTVMTAEKYDMANFDYAGYINDVQFEGGTDKGAELVIGSNKFIPGFEDQMIGMNVGETKDIFVTFPENYHAKEYAGKDAKFVIKLNSLKRYPISESNIKMLSGLDDMTVDSYREYLKEELRLNMLINYHFEEYVNLCKFDKLDQEKLDEYIEIKRESDQYYSSYYGMSVEEYSGHSAGSDYENYLKDYAEATYKRETVIEALIKVYDLQLSEREKTLSIHKYASEMGCSAETLMSYYSDETITKNFLNDVAMKFVVTQFTLKK